MGAALSSIGVSRPSGAMSTVWFARPTVWPVASTCSTGLGTGRRVRSLTMRKTSRSGLPTASPCGTPQSDSATGFRNVTSPPESVAITASPMLPRAIRQCCCCSRNSSSSRFRSVMSRVKHRVWTNTPSRQRTFELMMTQRIEPSLQRRRAS